MSRLIHIWTLLLSGCFCFGTLNAQTTLLEHYGYSTPNDSILLSEYMDPEYNYLFISYGSWCQNCKQELDEYLPYYSAWLNIFKTKIVVLDDFTIDNIEAGLDALSIYPYESLATNRIRAELDLFDFPTNFMYTKDRDLIIAKSGFTSAIEIDNLITNFFPKNPHPIFRGDVSQSVLRICENESTQIEYAVPELTYEINSKSYLKAQSSEGRTHYIREDTDALKVYYLDTISNEEYLLFDYNLKLCDELSIYSTSEKRMIDTHVIDVYCEGIFFHYELDIPVCSSVQENLKLISGIGTNVGLFPVFDELSHRNLLICHNVDNETIYEDWNSGNCGNLVNTNETAAATIHPIVTPNPVQDYFMIQHQYQSFEIISVTSISGVKSQLEKDAFGRYNARQLSPGIHVVNYIADGQNLNLRILKM